jgi:hypothetical protein
MKKSLKLAAMFAVATTPVLAASNMENPLYNPKAGTIYSKTAAGYMYKKAEDSLANQFKGHDGAVESPIWRAQEDLGYGITDALSARASLGYTHNGSIHRKGLHHGRLGLNYRVFDGASTDGIVWDVYGDAHLGGLSKMTGSYGPMGFKYDNYTNGRWGVNFGTQVGKTWGKFTAAVWGEILQTFGNHNNDINVKPFKEFADAELSAMIPGGAGTISACLANPAASPMCGMILPMLSASTDLQEAYGLTQLTDNISVNLKSTLEWNAGLKTAYEIDDAWTVGASFTYKKRADNGVKSVATAQSNPFAAGVAAEMASMMSNMMDGMNEYIVGVSVANQLTNAVQVALYGDYTFDTAHAMSQNGSDVKFEVGARVNVQF